MNAWWLNDFYWTADMDMVIGNHEKFIERQTTESVIQFYGMNISVVSGVYHPLECSSTHLLAQALMPNIGSGSKALDVGCGSGAISCLLADNFSAVFAIDIDDTALLCTKENTIINRKDNVTVLKSDLFEGIQQGEQFELMVFNAPLLHMKVTSKSPKPRNYHDHMSIDVGGAALIRFANEIKNHFTNNSKVFIMVSNIGEKDVITKVFGILSEYGEVKVVNAYYNEIRKPMAVCVVDYSGRF